MTAEASSCCSRHGHDRIFSNICNRALDNFIRRVDHSADGLGIGQERGDLLPAVKPALADRRVAGIPFVGECLQLVGGVVGVGGRVDLAQIGGDLLAVLVGDTYFRLART